MPLQLRRFGPWLAMLSVLALAASAAPVALDNNDIWIHLTTGRTILEEGTVPTTDRYSFTAAGNRYVAHEWLAAVYYAAAEQVGGLGGVAVAGKLLPAILLGALLLWSSRAAGGGWAAVIPIATLALMTARWRVVARPELLALLLMASTLGLLWRDRALAHAGRRSRSLYLLVPIAAIWANVHGSFPIGVVLVIVFAVAEWLAWL